MCGRTSLFVPVSALEERFDAEATPAVESFPPRYNVAPGADLAVVTNEAPGEIRAVEWGLVPGWADDPDDWGLVNARAETAGEKPAFRDAYESRRCVVLADGFYEWKADGTGRKQPYRITLGENEPFAMAGLWERRREAGRPATTTILTTEPNGVLEPIHDRMPVVFGDPARAREWLGADDAGHRADLLGPYAGDDMRAYPVSRAVNDPANDRPGVIERAGHQSGLDEFAG